VHAPGSPSRPALPPCNDGCASTPAPKVRYKPVNGRRSITGKEEIMVKARRMGHATFETPDLENAIAYYEKFMGLVVAEREKERAFLATKVGQLVIQLQKADRAHCIKLSFEVAPNSDFGELARELGNDCVRSELRNDSIPGIGQVLSFEDDKGTTIELFKEWNYLCKHEQVAGIGPFKLGHIAFFTPDIQRTVRFYEKVLGFRVSDWIGDFFCFMRCNADHHTVNFFTGPNVTLHHIAFELKDFMHLQNACELMGQRRVPIIWGPLRHGPGHNVSTYHRNPDGQVVEFFCELDQMVDEELGYFEPRPWHRDTPQRPRRWTPGDTSIWGLPMTEDLNRARA
jgi:catechol 2,3-dioxygenase-like lactoylglutathione lyase family enzyme